MFPALLRAALVDQFAFLSGKPALSRPASSAGRAEVL
jgi:hypothetical protein